MLILTRHGQTEFGAAGRCWGSLDAPLSEQGCGEADALALRLQDVKLHKIFCSTLSRAVLTAARIAELNPCPVEYIEALGERRFGIYEGQPQQQFQQALRQSGAAAEDFRPEGGESYEDLRLRLEPVLERIKAELEHGTVLVVAHGNVNRMLLTMLLGGSPADYPQDNCGVYVLERFAEGRYAAQCMNDVSHLGAG